jgi:hypothetical protein
MSLRCRFVVVGDVVGVVVLEMIDLIVVMAHLCAYPHEVELKARVLSREVRETTRGMHVACSAHSSENILTLSPFMLPLMMIINGSHFGATLLWHARFRSHCATRAGVEAQQQLGGGAKETSDAACQD